jgi:hypothetical protein
VKKTGIGLLVFVLIVLAISLGQCTSSASDIEQARAAIESAKAAQEAAKAANTAAAGLTMVAGGQTAILLMLAAALVATWAGIGYLVFQRARAGQGRLTVDGGRLAAGGRRQMSAGAQHTPAGVDMGQLTQLMTLRILADLAGGQKQRPESWSPMTEAQLLTDGADDPAEEFPW